LYHVSGVEFHGEFEQMLNDRDIRHVYANTRAPHHTAYAERAIRTIRERTARILESGKIKNPLKAIRTAVDTYNSSANEILMGESPNNVSRDNVGRILEHQLTIRKNQTDKYPRNISSYFKIGDVVRTRLPKTRFTKSNEPKFSQEIFEIIDIKTSSWPLESFVLKSKSTGAVPPGSFTIDQITRAN
jgi:hypothetical protein